jgi:hypothetical protein
VATAHRQEVLNVILAQLLQDRGVISAPENILKSRDLKRRHMPDVIVTFHGLRTAIEGEIGRSPAARDLALRSARKRVEDGIAHIGVAVVYPEGLPTVAFAKLKREMARQGLEIAVVTEGESTGFVPGDIDYLETALRHAFDQLVREDVVAEAVAALDAGIERFAQAAITKEGVVERLAEALGVRDLSSSGSEGEGESQ